MMNCDKNNQNGYEDFDNQGHTPDDHKNDSETENRNKHTHRFEGFPHWHHHDDFEHMDFQWEKLQAFRRYQRKVWKHRHNKKKKSPWMYFFRFVFAIGLLIFLLFIGGGVVLFFIDFFIGNGILATTTHRLIAGVVFFIVVFLIIRLIRVISSQFTRPLSQLIAASAKVADGDLSIRVDISQRGEFAQFADAFNYMVSELERSAQQRKNLTADIAHELRTPLHIIQGNLEGILDGVYNADEAHIQNTLEETRRMARLISDLNTLSLAEAGYLDMHFEKTDIVELVEDCITSFSGAAESAGVDLQFKKQRSGKENPVWVEMDPGRIDQVFMNLIQNALKFTSEGGRIELSLLERPDHVLIFVKDNGKGIPSEDLANLFDRFWKGDRSRKKTIGEGSGLGLAISQQFVLAHGGTIDVKSREGEGTEFLVQLPKVQPRNDKQENKKQE